MSEETAVMEMHRALRLVRKAAGGDSNDDEIDRLREALSLALGRWPEIDKEEMDYQEEDER